MSCNEKTGVLLQHVQPEIKDVTEKLNLVTTWLQLQILQIQDGNNFGVATFEDIKVNYEENLGGGREMVELMET